MADMLKFRKGTLAQINSAEKVAGTIYIAKDEKAMYVDVDASTRIRIGDFVRVATVNDIPFPASTSALYYVEADNALLGYDGENWKQINGTKDLTDRLSAAEEEIQSLKGTVGSASSGLVKDVNDLKTAVGDSESGLVADVATNARDIEALQAALGLGDGEESDGTLAGSVAQLRTDLTELEEEVHGTDGSGGMVATLANHTSRIGSLETESAKHALKTDLDAYAKTADIQGTLDKVDTEGTVTAAISAAVAAEKSRAEAAEQALTTELAAVKNTANSAVSNAIFEQFKTDNTTAINNAKTSAVSEATTAANGYTDGKIADEVTRANGAYAPKSLVDTVSSHTSTLNTLTSSDPSTAGSVAEAKKRADDAYDLAGQKTTMAEVEAKNYATKTEAQGYADAKDAAIQAAANAASAAQSAANAAQGDATQALSDAAAAQETIDNYIEAHENDYTNVQIDTAVADAKKAGTDAAATANANSGLISGHESRIAAIEADYLVQQDLDDAKAELSAEIDADIRSANAMTFEGIINSQSDFENITEAQIGDTYVIGTAFGNYQAGDFLIAKGEENAVTGNIINIEWNHVKSGYDASLDQQLTGANNQIMLSNGPRNDADAAGAITFAATGSASVAVANNTVTIGMVWEDF